MKQLLQIFLVMLKIGATTFGGGLVMIPQMSRDFVDRYGWIDKEDILDLFAVAQSLPGVIAINASILIGYKLRKVKGALAAALGAVLPSLIVLAVIAVFYDMFITNPAILGAFRAIRATVVALLFSAALSMGKSALKDRWFSAALAAAALGIALFTPVNVILIILGGALVGLLYGMLTRRKTA